MKKVNFYFIDVESAAPLMNNNIKDIELKKNTANEDTKSIEDIKRIANNIISPALVSFVWWVLINAHKNEQNKLYFMARDGYIMYRIAEQFCARFDLGIECRYLYGSRLAWRTAAYHLMGDEKYKYIFSGGYMITPKIILKRVQAGKKQRHKIYEDINKDTHIIRDKYDLSNENQTLNSECMRIFAQKLKRSRVFSEYLEHISKEQLYGLSMYLRQEGVFDETADIILVDSGWTGSIQRTLRQIAEHNMANPKITGYYFGLYAHSHDPLDGEYIAWYFMPGSRVRRMTNFNNNVFECMCASPFKMTTGYIFSENTGTYLPVFADTDNTDDENTKNGDNAEKAKLLNYYIESFTADFLNNSNINFNDYSDIYLAKSRKILQRFMMNPTKTEAELFGEFKFCDDSSDSYENNLACYIDEAYLKRYMIINRFLYKKSGGRPNMELTPDLFWFHGSLAVSEIKNKKWYRFNYKLWETLRLLVKKYEAGLRILNRKGLSNGVKW